MSALLEFKIQLFEIRPKTCEIHYYPTIWIFCYIVQLSHTWQQSILQIRCETRKSFQSVFSILKLIGVKSKSLKIIAEISKMDLILENLGFHGQQKTTQSILKSSFLRYFEESNFVHTTPYNFIFVKPYTSISLEITLFQVHSIFLEYKKNH